VQVVTLTVTPFYQNSRIIVDTKSNVCSVVDPGGDVELILEAITARKLTVESIFLTHAHIDHIGGVAELEEKLNTLGQTPKLYGNEIEANMRQSIAQQAVMFGLSPREFQNCREPDQYLNDGDIFKVGDLEFGVLFTPGHSPGHLSLFIKSRAVKLEENGRLVESTAPLLIAGDALFQGSIGRTDLPGGNHRQLIESIRTKLLTLPANTLVLSGHGPNTTIGEEARTNPFLT
jgi:hydroxyacylglutathione hydrolase